MGEGLGQLTVVLQEVDVAGPQGSPWMGKAQGLGMHSFSGQGPSLG